MLTCHLHTFPVNVFPNLQCLLVYVALSGWVMRGVCVYAHMCACAHTEPERDGEREGESIIICVCVHHAYCILGGITTLYIVPIPPFALFTEHT